MKHLDHSYISLFLIVVIWVSTAVLFHTGCTKLEKPEISVLSSPEDVFPAEGGESVFSIHTNGDWKASLASSSAGSWCEIEPQSGKSGDNIISLKIVKNDSFEERSTTIILKSGSAVKEITIS